MSTRPASVLAALAALAAGVLIMTLVLAARRRGPDAHRRRIRRAGKVLDRLARFDRRSEPARMFAYLRVLDPFVFEETILTALQHRGLPITRNRRYTGDGGIDGRCRIRGRLVLIQVKRYRKHIDPAHLAAFAALCRRDKALGLFVHTGRTGRASRDIARREDDVEIVSGARLLDLLTGQPVTLLAQPLPGRPAKANRDDPHTRE